MLRIRIAVLGAAVMLGATAVSTTTAVAQGKGRHQRAEQAGGRGGRGQPGTKQLLRGIDLTDAQTQSVKAIGDRYATQFSALRDSLRPAMEQARAARQRGDTTAARKAWLANGDERQRMATLMQREADEVRGVLTPAQQTQFDKNRDAMRNRMHDRAGKDRGGRKGHRPAR